MRTLERAQGVAALSRIAVLLSNSYKNGVVSESLVEALKQWLPGASMLSVSLPSSGLAEILLISSGNFLIEGYTTISLYSLEKSAAGNTFSGNTFNASTDLSSGHSDEGVIRCHDAEHAKEVWGVESLLCCPIPLSTPAAVASQSFEEASSPRNSVLGVLSLGLSTNAASIERLQEVLKELALHLAETIERDSKAVVDQVCQYHLGAPRSEQVETPSKEFSASCSDEGRDESSDSGPPSGALPQLVNSEGGSGGTSGADQGDRGDGAGRGGRSGGASQLGETEPKGKAMPSDSEVGAAHYALGSPLPDGITLNSEANWMTLDGQKTTRLWDDPDAVQAGPSCNSPLNGAEGRPADFELKQRAKRMLDTFDARAAGCSGSAFEAAAYDSEEKVAAKKSSGAERVRSFARTSTMTFVDEGLEAEFALWQARQRWQLDAAGLLFLLFITGVSISMAPSPSDPSTQRFWLAGLMHALPLLTMLNIPWYMCNRERVLGAYLVCSAFHAVYLSGRAALHLEPQSALAALVWFSRVQAAEPLLFHAVMFALRFRTALLVQAVCVVLAMSNATTVCANCCSSFMSPTFCFFKALTTQVVFGFGVPVAAIYFTEENFRQIFADACMIQE